MFPKFMMNWNNRNTVLDISKEMIVTFMQMEYKGFSCFDYDKIVNLMEQKLKTYTGKFERRYLEVLSENLDFVQKYNQIVEPLFSNSRWGKKTEKK